MCNGARATSTVCSTSYVGCGWVSRGGAESATLRITALPRILPSHRLTPSVKED